MLRLGMVKMLQDEEVLPEENLLMQIVLVEVLLVEVLLVEVLLVEVLLDEVLVGLASRERACCAPYTVEAAFTLTPIWTSFPP
jgi:hypothetical protein